jgi:hypothetical protein
MASPNNCCTFLVSLLELGPIDRQRTAHAAAGRHQWLNEHHSSDQPTSSDASRVSPNGYNLGCRGNGSEHYSHRLAALLSCPGSSPNQL